MLPTYDIAQGCPPRSVLLYRPGDFFEFFFRDALLLRGLLELTLTGKEGGKGIGAADAVLPTTPGSLLHELVRHGLSIAFCDQLRSGGRQGQLLKRTSPGDHPRHPC